MRGSGVTRPTNSKKSSIVWGRTHAEWVMALPNDRVYRHGEEWGCQAVWFVVST